MECREDVPRELAKAMGEFNGGEWFECHETLEELWIGERGELRDFYQGLLQIAVALHHWKTGNYGGALSLLKGGSQYLERVRPVCCGVDVAGMVAAALALRGALVELGAERMWQVDRVLIPTMRLAASEAD